METLSGPLGEIRRASALTGTAMSTTAALTLLPKGTAHVYLTPRNFSTAVVVGVAVNPYLIVLKTDDLLVTAPDDYSDAAQDGSTTTDIVLSSLDTAANGDFLYVGSHIPFRGVTVDVDAANGTASVLTVKYWDGNS